MKKMMLRVLALTFSLGFAFSANAQPPLAAAKPGKCVAAAAAVVSAKAANASATTAYEQCKAKHPRMHLVRCRALKKAMVDAQAALAAARHRRRVCQEGCGWLAKQATDAANAYAACKEKHKLTHLARCRPLKAAATTSAVQLAACKARKP